MRDGSGKRPFIKEAAEGLLLFILFIAALSFLSHPDAEYLISMPDLSLISLLILMFVLIYGTPVYIAFFLLSRIGKHFGIDVLENATSALEFVASLPLYPLCAGPCVFYFELAGVQDAKRQKEILLTGANLTGIIILAAFQARIMAEAMLALALLTLFLATHIVFLNALKVKAK